MASKLGQENSRRRVRHYLIWTGECAICIELVVIFDIQQDYFPDQPEKRALGCGRDRHDNKEYRNI